MSWLCTLQYSRNIMRIVRNGKRKSENKDFNEGNSHMPKLRKKVVNFLEEIGEASGCHRMPERSFFFKGYQFPVCARCTGVAIGQFIALVLGLFKKVISITSFSLIALLLWVLIGEYKK